MSSANTPERSSRFPPIPPEAMNAEQRLLVEEYVRTGRRTSAEVAQGNLGGALDVTLRSPELARRLAGLMSYFKRGTALPERLNEFAILFVAREWDSPFQWQVHRPMAIAAGLSETTVSDLAHNRHPSAMKPDEAAVYAVLLELHREHSVRDETFQKAKDILGERCLIDLLGVSGYYTLTAQLHRTADLGAPGGPDETFPAAKP